jgi:hypothetical protein
VVKGYAMGGICLIRIKEVRPRLFPGFVGMASENAAVRFSVQWDLDGEVREGVYIPRRVTNSRFNTFVGGRFFPGVHHHARFEVSEAHPYYDIALESDDGQMRLFVKGTVTEWLPRSSIFSSVDEASAFFRAGALGYSETRTPGIFEGVERRSVNWRVTPLIMERVECNLFGDGSDFPPGSAEYECALLMRSTEHEWHGLETLHAEELRCAA